MIGCLDNCIIEQGLLVFLIKWSVSVFVSPCICMCMCFQYCLELYNPNSKGQKIKACKTETDGRVVEGKHQSYMICASTAEERDDWIEAIRSHTTSIHSLMPLLPLNCVMFTVFTRRFYLNCSFVEFAIAEIM